MYSVSEVHREREEFFSSGNIDDVGRFDLTPVWWEEWMTVNLETTRSGPGPGPFHLKLVCQPMSVTIAKNKTVKAACSCIRLLDNEEDLETALLPCFQRSKPYA